MRIALIADDLTGANNAGVRLVRQGFSTATVTHGASSLPHPYDAICVDTDSRYVAADEARQRVLHAAGYLRAQGAQLLCKRVDSLLRGNVGAEIDAILSASDPGALAVVVAAYPDSDRVVKGGHLLVNGVPVNHNMVAASDPISPVLHSYIPDIIAAQSKERVALITLDVVEKGVDVLTSQLSAVASAGTRIVVIDAISEEQVESIAHAMMNLARPIVPVDPGPLSAAYARVRFGHRQHPHATRKILMCVGSTTALTREQLEHVIGAWRIEPTYVRADHLTSNSDKRTREIEKAIVEGLERLKNASIGIVTTVHPAALVDLERVAKAEGATPHALAKRIADGLAQISCGIIARSSGAVAGCYSSGGDVTAAFYKVAGSKGFEIIDEVAPLIAHVRLLGGAFDGLLMVTKGGSVGEKSTASECLRFLFGKL